MTPEESRWRDKLSEALRAAFRDLNESQREHIVREVRRHRYELPDLPSDLPSQCDRIIDALMEAAGGLNFLARKLILYPGDSRSFVTLVQQILPETQTYLSLAEKLAVISDLEAVIDPAHLGRHYAEITKSKPLRRLTSVADLVAQIGQRANPPGALDPLLHLLAAAARDSADRTRGAACLQQAHMFAAWIDDSRTGRETTPRQSEQLDLVYRETRAGDQQQTANAFIVLSLRPWPTRPDDHFLISAWLFFDDGDMEKLEASAKALDLSAVQAETERIINVAIQIAEQRHNHFTPVIEFFLDREHLNLEVESWRVGGAPIGMQFVVVVRDWDRQDTKGGTARIRGRDKWRNMDVRRPAREILQKWISCGEATLPEGELYRTLLQTQIAAAGLTFPPAPPAPGLHPFRNWELLNSGVPIAVWPHSCTHAANGSGLPRSAWFTDFKHELVTHDRAIGELPQIVLELRRKITRLDDASHGLALLWEDPGRIVKPDHFKLAAPGTGGPS